MADEQAGGPVQRLEGELAGVREAVARIDPDDTDTFADHEAGRIPPIDQSEDSMQ